MSEPRRLQLTCNFCSWSKPVRFFSPGVMPIAAQEIVAAMGAATFDHELRMHMKREHPNAMKALK